MVEKNEKLVPFVQMYLQGLCQNGHTVAFLRHIKRNNLKSFNIFLNIRMKFKELIFQRHPITGNRVGGKKPVINI